MKFKVGDKVRANITNPKHTWLLNLSGKEGIIERVFSCANPDKGCYHVSGMEYVMSEEDLELVKPKFDYIDYMHGDYAIHCKTIEEAETYVRYMKWHNRNVVSSDNWRRGGYKTNLCFNVNRRLYGERDYYESMGYTILEFEDFDWSDFEMAKKNFTKADLRNGDVVKWDDGDVSIVCVDTGTLICKNSGFNHLGSLSDDLVWCGTFSNGHKIIAVRRPNNPTDCRFDAFDYRFGTLVYERKEVEEMTLEEVCKALGKEIKIVKK